MRTFELECGWGIYDSDADYKSLPLSYKHFQH